MARIAPSILSADFAALQRTLVRAASDLVSPGGFLVYSVCTLTAGETTDIDDWLGAALPDWVACTALQPPWERVGRGARLLPQTASTDGMYLLALRRPRQ